MSSRKRPIWHTVCEYKGQAVVLTYFQGLKYREAAEVLDIPVGSLRVIW